MWIYYSLSLTVQLKNTVTKLLQLRDAETCIKRKVCKLVIAIFCSLPTRSYASAGTTSSGPVSVCLCLSQVGVLSKRMNESGWFLARELPLTYPTL